MTAEIKRELGPIDHRLDREIVADHADRDHAEDQHLAFELSAVALEIGIVLAGISILAGRRWLLGGGAGVAAVGVGLLILGALLSDTGAVPAPDLSRWPHAAPTCPRPPAIALGNQL